MTRIFALATVFTLGTLAVGGAHASASAESVRHRPGSVTGEGGTGARGIGAVRNTDEREGGMTCSVAVCDSC